MLAKGYINNGGDITIKETQVRVGALIAGGAKLREDMAKLLQHKRGDVCPLDRSLLMGDPFGGH